MKPTLKPQRTAEQRAEEEALRRQHTANPVRQRPAGVVDQQSFAAILNLMALAFSLGLEHQLVKHHYSPVLVPRCANWA